ncbi:MAG: SGNH/GDSL hydrolase family protein [Dysgonomonas sp.]
MKKNLLLSLLLAIFSPYISAQKLNDMVNMGKYEKANSELAAPQKGVKRVVFIGNSITEGWVNSHPDFFTSNNYIGRGISGQTSPQLLLRFRQDVVALKPVAVVINVGTNDIAENTGNYSPGFTLGNIKSMVEIAKANNIKVILSSVLPADGFSWNKSITDATAKIEALNKEIQVYAKEQKLAYIDYNSSLRDDKGAMKAGYSKDGVHPNKEAYTIMESVAKAVIDKVVK